MTVRRFVRRRSAETPLTKRALMKRGLLEHNNYFWGSARLAGKTSQGFSSSALFSCHKVWIAHVRSVVNNISKYQTPIDSSTLWRYVTILARHDIFYSSLKPVTHVRIDDASGRVAWPFVTLPLQVFIVSHVQYLCLCYGC